MTVLRAVLWPEPPLRCIVPSPLQEEQFGMYALYSKNKPQSDALLCSHGLTFFKVISQPASLLHHPQPGPN